MAEKLGLDQLTEEQPTGLKLTDEYEQFSQVRSKTTEETDEVIDIDEIDNVRPTSDSEGVLLDPDVIDKLYTTQVAPVLSEVVSKGQRAKINLLRTGTGFFSKMPDKILMFSGEMIRNISGLNEGREAGLYEGKPQNPADKFMRGILGYKGGITQPTFGQKMDKGIFDFGTRLKKLSQKNIDRIEKEIEDSFPVRQPIGDPFKKGKEGRDVAGDLAGGSLSWGASIAIGVLSGGVGILSGIAFGVNQTLDKFVELSKRSDKKNSQREMGFALAYGFGEGTWEFLKMDTIFKLTEQPVKSTMKQFMKFLFTQTPKTMVIEGFQESGQAFTEIVIDTVEGNRTITTLDELMEATSQIIYEGVLGMILSGGGSVGLSTYNRTRAILNLKKAGMNPTEAQQAVDAMIAQSTDSIITILENDPKAREDYWNIYKAMSEQVGEALKDNPNFKSISEQERLEKINSISVLQASQAVAEATKRGITAEEYFKNLGLTITTSEESKQDMGGLLFQNPLLRQEFYSKLERTIEQKIPNKASAQQIKNTLAKDGVKADEMDWIGLDTFLEQNKNPTKAELLDFVRKNQVKLNVRVLQDDVDDEVFGNEIDRINDQIEELESELEGSATDEEYDFISGRINNLEDRRAGIVSEARETAGATRFGDQPILQVAGEKTGYGEVVISTEPYVRVAPKYAGEDIATDLGNGQWRIKMADGSTRTVTAKDGNKAIQRVSRIEEANYADRVYLGGHYEFPNTIVHYRFNIRKDSDGKTVMFIEEIQSDLHRRGLDVGYKTLKDRGALTEEWRDKVDSLKPIFKQLDYLGFDTFSELVSEIANNPSFVRNYNIQDEIDAGLDPKVLTTIEEVQTLRRKLDEDYARVPNLPFRRTWKDLAIKDILDRAVKMGVDKVAFISGDQTAQRYNLSKSVEKISWKPQGKLKLVSIDMKESIDGFEHFEELIDAQGNFVQPAIRAWKGKNIRDVIGKGIGQRILSEKSGKISEEGLAIGGEGLKNLYDIQIPSLVAKYIKKWGGRVEDIQLGQEGVEPERYTMSIEHTILKFREDELARIRKESHGSSEAYNRKLPEVNRKYKPYQIIAPNGDVVEAYATEALAEGALDRKQGKSEIGVQKGFIITDQMKDAILREGQPLYQDQTDEQKQVLQNDRKIHYVPDQRQHYHAITGEHELLQTETDEPQILDRKEIKEGKKPDNVFDYGTESAIDPVSGYSENTEMTDKMINKMIDGEVKAVRVGKDIYIIPTGKGSRSIPAYKYGKPMEIDNKKVKGYLFNLPAIFTCKNAFGCAGTCYTMSAQMRFPAVRMSRFSNLYMYMWHKNTINKMIDKQLDKKSRGMVRFHESGDIFSQNYLDFLTNIVRRHPDLQFYTYTKYKDLDYSNITSLENFNLVESSMPNGERNYGNKTYIGNLSDKYGTPICPASTQAKGIAPSKETKCGLEGETRFKNTCKMCLHNKYMLFLEHGVPQRKKAMELLRRVMTEKQQRTLPPDIAVREGEDIRDTTFQDYISLFQKGKDDVSLQPDTKLEPRGQIQFRPNEAVISVLQNADISTLPHELAHLWLNDMWAYAKTGQGSQQYRKEWTALSKWLGIQKGQTDLTVEQQEKFARGFEAYLTKGTESKNMGKMFMNFKRWMGKVYNGSQELGVDMSPENQEFFDRMFDVDKEYVRNIELIDKKVTRSRSGFMEWVDKLFVPISTRAYKVAPELRDAMRRFEFNVKTRTMDDIEEAEKFLKEYAKLNKEDWATFDMALKNRDITRVEEIINRNGLQEEWKELRSLLDRIFQEAKDANLNINFLDEYFPRVIADVPAFMAYLRGNKNWSIINEAIVEETNRMGRELSEEEKSTFINKMVRGFGKNQLRLRVPSNVKERKIDILDSDMNRFYKDSSVALTDYIIGMRNAIESRKFFGIDKHSVNESIGTVVRSLISDGTISAKDEVEVKRILTARFNERGTRGFITSYKNLVYIYTMGSPISAITQIGDLGFSLYDNGFYLTVKNTFRSVFRRKRLTKKDIGIDSISDEFRDPSKSAKAVSKLFKVIGLEGMDAMGKETLINASLDKLSKKAKKNDKELIEELERIFGKSEAEQVRQDLVAKNTTEDVKYMLFAELSNFQPISVSEMPEQYVSGGNSRLWYTLKSFTIKQIDAFHNEAFIGMGKHPAKSLGNLIRLAMSLALMNASADVIKAVLLGRKIEISDLVMDNILRLMGFSKWTIYQAKSVGIGEAVLKSVLFPIPYVDDVYKTAVGLTKGKPLSDTRMLSGVPVVGKFLYWWFGGGSKLR